MARIIKRAEYSVQAQRKNGMHGTGTERKRMQLAGELRRGRERGGTWSTEKRRP